MATKMNMLKLLQEVRGINDFPSHRPQPRSPGALFLPIRSFKSPAAQRKHIIRINIQDPVDIPTPVKIVFLDSTADA